MELVHVGARGAVHVGRDGAEDVLGAAAARGEGREVSSASRESAKGEEEGARDALLDDLACREGTRASVTTATRSTREHGSQAEPRERERAERRTCDPALRVEEHVDGVRDRLHRRQAVLALEHVDKVGRREAGCCIREAGSGAGPCAREKEGNGDAPTTEGPKQLREGGREHVRNA